MLLLSVIFLNHTVNNDHAIRRHRWKDLGRTLHSEPASFTRLSDWQNAMKCRPEMFDSHCDSPGAVQFAVTSVRHFMVT